VSAPAADTARRAALGPLARAVASLDAVPYWLLALPLRVAVANIFWSSAMTKLPSWDSTLALFRDEYKVPLLAPETAAYMATAIELSMPVLLILGLGARAASAVLLGMTAVIEIFIYPLAWPTHLQWAAMLLILLCRGPGVFSLDHLIRDRVMGR
jgi:putative oxidoreductase